MGYQTRYSGAPIDLPGRRFIAGSYFPPMHTGLDTTVSPTLNTEYCVRFEVGAATTFDRIGIEVTTNVASAVVRLGIRYDSGSMAPGQLLLDAGTVDAASSTGFKEATISQLLTPGRWWLSLTLQTATGVAVRARSNDPMLGQGVTTSTLNVGSYSNASGKTGALPASFGTLGYTSAAPKILLRAA